jgi:DNA-binding transcriptional LysR family regulator
MKRSELADLAAFVAVGELLSFRAAAARLGITRSALSHAIQQLENRLDVRLLHRTTRHVALTDQGRRLFERLRAPFGGIHQALAELDRERASASGSLRLHISAGAMVAVMAPIWSRFLAAHPRVKLELVLGDEPVDVVVQGFDAAITIRDFAAADMIAVKVSEPWKLVIVASPSYLARRGAPLAPDDLAAHDCFQYRWDDRLFPWPFARTGKQRRLAVQGNLTVNSSELALRAAIDGLGLACVNEAIAEPFVRSGQLVRVLEDRMPYFDGYFLVYSGRRQVPSPLRALIDMLRAERRRRRDQDSGPSTAGEPERVEASVNAPTGPAGQ